MNNKDLELVREAFEILIEDIENDLVDNSKTSQYRQKLLTNTEELGGLTPCSSSTRLLTPRLCLFVSFISCYNVYVVTIEFQSDYFFIFFS